jgi:iron-sulfur cluster assembly protein
LHFPPTSLYNKGENSLDSGFALNPANMTTAAPPALPEGVRKGNENLILLTESAGRKIHDLMERERSGDYLRIAISGGGCNGLSYKMRFTSVPKRGDILVDSSGASVIVDSKSALYLKGTHLDYSTELISGGFKFSNPNAKSSCSCGESFSL